MLLSLEFILLIILVVGVVIFNVIKKQSTKLAENKSNDELCKTINDVKAELRNSQDKTLSLSTIISEHKTTTEKLQYETNKLSKTLSNNQLRGAFGQEIAQDLLKIIGFVNGIDYTTQEQQNTGNRPDITFYLPNKTKINIDVKFPLQSFQHYIDTENTAQKKEFLTRFKTDIKARIKEIATKDYINSKENTVDFAIMFIPNENIFSFIYEHFKEEHDHAFKNKIFICGPVSFASVLRIIRQFSDNINYQKNLMTIISHIKTFEKECIKSREELNKLGKKINDVSNVYDELSGTRDRQLTKAIDKINSIDESLILENISSDK